MLLHHIGIVVRDSAPIVRLFEALGLRVQPPRPNTNVCAELTCVDSAPVSIEIRRPAGEGPIAQILAKRGPGIHHVMFDVDGLPAVVEALRGKGVRFLGGVREHPWQLQAWIDPRQAHGGLIELGEVWERTGPCRPRPGEPTVGHLGWAVRDLQAARGFFLTMGLPVDRIGPDTAVFVADETAVRCSPCTISLKMPSGPGPFARFLEKKGPGLHHLMLRVQDIGVASRAAREAGFRLAFGEPLDEGFALTQFVHPKDTEGVLIELGQSRQR
jgi:catechol 2,3-dioxygenase-like lactoylglutathione lyase family enzyme